MTKSTQSSDGEALIKGLGQQPSQKIIDQYILSITIFNFSPNVLSTILLYS